MATTWRNSLLTALLKLTVKKYFAKLARLNSVAELMPHLRKVRTQLAHYRLPLPTMVSLEHCMLANAVPAIWVKPDNLASRRTILYLHGGAYVIGSAAMYLDLACRLAAASAAQVFLVDYRLAPEWPFPSALVDALMAYQYLLVDIGLSAQQIVMSGDSAGGGLALATLLALRDQDKPLPAAAVVFSPWTDLALTGQSLITNRLSEAYLVMPEKIIFYGEEASMTDPLVSPLYGDLTGLPPLFLQASSSELLLDDARRFADKARLAGVATTLEIWPELPHVWQFFAKFLPEGRQALIHAGNFIKQTVP